MISPSSRFLVIDDANSMVVMVKHYLRDLGVKDVSVASTGIEAYKKLSDAHDIGLPFDFIISDLNMPNLNGLELLEKCSKDVRFKSVPFLMLTSESEKKLVIKAVILGVSDYLLKPFSPQALENKILAVIKRAQK